MTIHRIDAAWAAFFGLSPPDFLSPGTQVVAHHWLGDYQGAWLFRHHASLCLSVPPGLVDAVRTAVPAHVGPEVEGAVVVTQSIVPAGRKLKLLLHDPSIVDLRPVQVETQLHTLREVAGDREAADKDSAGSPDPNDPCPRVPRELNPGIHVEGRA